LGYKIGIFETHRPTQRSVVGAVGASVGWVGAKRKPTFLTKGTKQPPAKDGWVRELGD